MLDLTVARQVGGVRVLHRRLTYPDVLRLIRFYHEAVAEHGDGLVLGNGGSYLALPEAELGGTAWRRDCLTGMVLNWLVHQTQAKGLQIARLRVAKVSLDGDFAEGTNDPVRIHAEVSAGGEPFELPPLERLDIWRTTFPKS